MTKTLRLREVVRVADPGRGAMEDVEDQAVRADRGSFSIPSKSKVWNRDERQVVFGVVKERAVGSAGHPFLELPLQVSADDIGKRQEPALVGRHGV